MSTAIKQHDRITISLPHGYSGAIKSLAAELDLSQSDLIAKAFDLYRESQQRKKVEETARSMADEYRHNADLVVFTSLDGEDFR
jgi:hypothetical protein